MQKEEPTEHTEHTESSCHVHGQRQTRVHRLVCFRGEPSRPLWLNLPCFPCVPWATCLFQLHRSGLTYQVTCSTLSNNGWRKAKETPRPSPLPRRTSEAPPTG